MKKMLLLHKWSEWKPVVRRDLQGGEYWQKTCASCGAYRLRDMPPNPLWCGSLTVLLCLFFPLCAALGILLGWGLAR